MCAALFSTNLSALTMDQAKYICDLDNRNPIKPDFESLDVNERKGKYIDNFRKEFGRLFKEKNVCSKIRMMDNRNRQKKDTICKSPYFQFQKNEGELAF